MQPDEARAGFVSVAQERNERAHLLTVADRQIDVGVV